MELSMKNSFITFIASSAVCVAMLLASRTMTVDPAAHTRYYLTSVVMISGILSVITLLRLIRSFVNKNASPEPFQRHRSEQRRQSYRLTFESSDRPRFVQSADGDLPAGSFTCPVLDISETGISLGCTGVYATGQTVRGEIIFSSFRRIVVNGVVVREDEDRTSLKLHSAIDPPLLMAEQRQQITMNKGATARPAVSEDVLEKPSASLPSQRPNKGICRLK
jgi:hypothetical protein